MEKTMESIMWNKVEEYWNLNKKKSDFGKAFKNCHEEVVFLARESNLPYAMNSFREAWKLCEELYQQEYNKNRW